MTPEEARKLLGGYATGSLTEAERTALVQAALEDQDLFDELAGEHVLKEVLDEPGARQRLIAALEPSEHKTYWAMRRWAAWAVLVLSFSVILSIIIQQRTPPPQQIAQVMKSPEPVSAPIAAPHPGPKAVKAKVAPAPAAPVPPPPTVAELNKDLQKAESENKLADQVQPARPPAAAPQAVAGAVRQFAPAAPQAAAARTQNEIVTVTQTVGPVVFSYAIGTDGFLQISTVESGFVSVEAEFSDKDTIVFPASEADPKMPIRIQVPANATGFILGFSKTPGVNDSRIGRPLVPGLGFDPDPPNRRFRIEVPAAVITPPSLTPAPR